MASVEIRDLCKHLGGVAAVRNLSFDVEAGLGAAQLQRPASRRAHTPLKGRTCACFRVLSLPSFAPVAGGTISAMNQRRLKDRLLAGRRAVALGRASY